MNTNTTFNETKHQEREKHDNDLIYYGLLFITNVIHQLNTSVVDLKE